MTHLLLRGFVVLAIIALVAHFLVTDPLRSSRPLELKVLGGTHAMIAETPEFKEKTSKAEAAAMASLKEANTSANNFRLWAGTTKWIGIGLTAVMMVIAGALRTQVTDSMAQNNDELRKALKNAAGKRKRLHTAIGILSATVAASTMIGSHLESERTSAVARAKTMQALFYELRKQVYEAPSLPSREEALLKLQNISDLFQ